MRRWLLLSTALVLVLVMALMLAARGQTSETVIESAPVPLLHGGGYQLFNAFHTQSLGRALPSRP